MDYATGTEAFSDFPRFFGQNNEISVIMKLFGAGPKSHAGADETSNLISLA
jgi:hypothetical protein